MSALNAFGAILTYSIGLENQLADFYKSAGDAGRAAEAEKRRSKLERVRRESVLEITLEPIDGLDETHYQPNWSDTSAAGQKAVEGILARYYADVAPKINVREAQRALEKCGKEHAALS